jgi:hypothetical protein
MVCNCPAAIDPWVDRYEAKCTTKATEDEVSQIFRYLLCPPRRGLISVSVDCSNPFVEKAARRPTSRSRASEGRAVIARQF